MKNRALGFLLFLLLAPLLFAEEKADPKTNLIIEVLKINGGMEVFDPSIENFIRTCQRQYPELSSSDWAQVRERMKFQLVDATVKVWSSYYSEEDLRAIRDFYNSPAGKKMTRNSSAITSKLTQESEQVGQQTVMMIRSMATTQKTPAPVPSSPPVR